MLRFRFRFERSEVSFILGPEGIFSEVGDFDASELLKTTKELGLCLV